MKRKFYYPSKVAEQPAWHFNYATQLTELGVGMGLVLADVTASANDSRQLGYAIGEWLNGVREFGPGATGQVEVLGVTADEDDVDFVPAAGFALRHGGGEEGGGGRGAAGAGRWVGHLGRGW